MVKTTSQETQRRRKLFQDYLRSEDYQKRLIERLKINDACKNPKARALTWALCRREDNPAEGAIFFLENFGWTFDPRPQAEPHNLPFILFDYQKDAVRWLVDHIEHGTDGLVEKSRDMGMSWVLFVWVPLWYWLFKDGSNILIGSYKQDLVDNRTKDSLFGMIDYGVDSLPKWLLPRGFKRDKHRTQMKLINPQTFSLITGDTMNPDFGRGSRKTAVLFDELGTWDYAREAWESAGQSTACRVANSTPKGFNYYAKLRFSGIDVKTFHWKEHPLKDDDWYEFEKTRNTEEAIAQELDISYTKSQEGRVYPEWNEQNVERGCFEYDEDLPLYVGWDFGKCMSEDTQALTKNGWKHYYEVNEGDEIYTLNSDSMKGEWNKVEGKSVFPYAGKLKMFNSNRMKARFTPTHHWLVLEKRGRDRHLVPQIKSFEDFRSLDSIPLAVESNEFPKKKYSDNFVKLAAWFWTEGYINDGGVEIGQAIPGNISIIRDILNREFNNGWVEREPKLRKNTNLPLTRFYIHKDNAEKLLSIVDENKAVKYEFINSLTKKQLEIFLEHSLLTDGHENVIKQSNAERTERIGYVMSLLGYRTSYFWDENSYGVRGGTDRTLDLYNYTLRNKRIIDVDYRGVVWCPTVKNSVWLARSEGKTYFTGNTDDTAIIWCQPDRDGYKIVDTYRNAGKTIDFYVPFITGIIPSDNYSYTPKDLQIIEEHKYWKRGTHFGDPAGRFTNQVVNQSVLDVLKEHGIIINFQDRWKEFQKRKTAAKLMIREGIKLNKNERTDWFDNCMVQANYPRVSLEGEKEVRSVKPVHNWTSHYRSAFEYLALGLQEFKHQRRQPYDKFKPRKGGRAISY